MYRIARFFLFCLSVFALFMSLAVSSFPITAQAATSIPTISLDGLRTRDLQIDLGDGWTSHAQLSWPAQGSGPFPTVILFHGSCDCDMDETLQDTATGPILSTNFRLIAQQLGLNGIAVLRFNRRGVRANNDEDGDQVGKSFVIGRMVADGESVIAAALAQPEVDANRLYLYGWSQGTMVATQLAIYNPDLAGLILHGALNETISDTLNYQVQQVIAYFRDTLDSNKDGKVSLDELQQLPSTGHVHDVAQEVYDSSSTPDQPVLDKSLDTNGDGLIDIQAELVPFFQAQIGSIAATNPDRYLPLMADVLTRLQLPVLLLAGENDGYVAPTNAQSLAQALGARATLKLYPGLGHSLGNTPSPIMDDAALPMDQQPINDVAAWILAQK